MKTPNLSRTIKSIIGYRAAFEVARYKDRISDHLATRRLFDYLHNEFSGRALRDYSETISHPFLTSRLTTVWRYWHQGWKTSPPIVQRVKSINDSRLGSSVSFEDLDFASFPEEILRSRDAQQLLQMNSNGKLGLAGLTDYLRMRLVAEHGGTWLDSTVLVNPDRFLEHLRMRDIFLNVQGNTDAPSLSKWTLVTWFFKATQSRRFLNLWSSVLASAWLRNGGSYTYFDASRVATHLILQGFKPNNDMTDDRQQLILLQSSDLLLRCIDGSNSSDLNLVYQKSDLHKFSHKVSLSEERRILQSLEGF